MVQKAKIFYFTTFVLVIFAFILHITAMGHHHWKKADGKNTTVTGFNYTTIGLFTRCILMESNRTELCFQNKYPRSSNCYSWYECLKRSPNETCQCGFLPSTKGIASCAIIASVFLGLSIIILFIHSINTSETRSVGLFLGFCPLLLLLLAFVFILIVLILVGSYLSRDIMHIVRQEYSMHISKSIKNKNKNMTFYSRFRFGCASTTSSSCIRHTN